MFITIEEMKAVLYEYQMNDIVENDDDIVLSGIVAAIEEVRSYLAASNERRYQADLDKQQYTRWKVYDLDAIFNAADSKRNAFILRLCQRIAAYNVCELSNVDVVYNHVKERYEGCIKTLEKIAGMGEYANAQLFISSLPSPASSGDEDNGNANEVKPFRAGSRPKFQHE
jgi:hypothetical protein